MNRALLNFLSGRGYRIAGAIITTGFLVAGIKLMNTPDIKIQNPQAVTQIKKDEQTVDLDALFSKVEQQESEFEKGFQQLALSLEGTDIDGALESDKYGDLVVNLALKDFYDYVLSAIGEITPEQAIGFIKYYAYINLPESAANDVMNILQNYLQYRQSAIALRNQPLLPREEQNTQYYLSTLTNVFSQLHDLRQFHLGPIVADAFFADEEAYFQYSIKKAEIQMTENLSANQKFNQIEKLRLSLPEKMQDSIDRQQMQERKKQQVENIVVSNKSIEEKRDALYEYHGKDMVDRIINDMNIDHRHKALFSQYLSEREMICASGWDKEEERTQLDKLKQRLYKSEQEKNIVSMLEARFIRDNKSKDKCSI